MTAKIHTYMPNAQGHRARSFTVDDVEVLVRGHDDDDRAKAVAEFLASAPSVIDGLRAEVQQLRVAVPPTDPVRIGEGGCVRMRDGELWLLNHAHTGWASFGVRLASWDDLFRRYNAIVVEHGCDAFGDYWKMAPPPRQKETP